MFRTIIVAIILFISTVCSATVWEMQPDGGGDFATIQDAVDGAADGDTISFQVGTYTGPGNWDVTIDGRWLTLIGQVEMVNLLIEKG